jgi:hypothetical protein
MAAEILRKTDKIRDPAGFVLGSIAPDSAHHQDGYTPALKKITHLLNSTEEWGKVTGNGKWTADVLSYLSDNRELVDRDFLLGYCIHILSDIRNNILNWTPFTGAHPDHATGPVGKQYHQEQLDVDSELHQKQGDKLLVWDLLRQSRERGLPGVIDQGSVGKMKQHILNIQYATKRNASRATRELVSYEATLAFITGESEFVFQQIRDFL